MKYVIFVIILALRESLPLNPEILKYDEFLKNFEVTGRRMKQEAKDQKIDGKVMKRESHQMTVGSSINQTVGSISNQTADESSEESSCKSSQEIEAIAQGDPKLALDHLRKKHDKLKRVLVDKETELGLMKQTCITHIMGLTLKEFERHYWNDGHYKIDKNFSDVRKYPDYKTQDQYTTCEAFFNFNSQPISQGGEILRNETLKYLNANGLSVHNFCYKIWKIDQIRLFVVHVLEFVDDVLKEYDVPTSRMKTPPFTRGNLTLVEGDENILNALIKLVHANREEFRLENDPKHGGLLLETNEC